MNDNLSVIYRQQRGQVTTVQEGSGRRSLLRHHNAIPVRLVRLMSGMKDECFTAAEARAGGMDALAVSRFAKDVVARLVSGTDRGGEVLRMALVDRLVDAVRRPDAAAFASLQPELRKHRITVEQFADHYIPEAARQLGHGWEDDLYSFAEVSMGVARLQAILREIGDDWAADAPRRGQSAQGNALGTGTILVILPAGEHHSLGAMVLAGQLRRLGISVCLQIAPDSADLAALLAQRRFGGVLISIAGQDRLETCQSMIKTIKDSVGNGVKVAVGGAIFGDGQADLGALGADVVTNDLTAALVALGFAPANNELEAVK